MRARKPKDVEGTLARYAEAIESEPAAVRGRWLDARQMSGVRMAVDIGCGKGSFAIEFATRNPDWLVVAIDVEPICIAMAARKAVEARVPNVVFAECDVASLGSVFADGEVARVFLNFSTPMPKAKCADRRLTYAENLVEYRRMLSPGGKVCMKTDSRPLFDWSLGQLEIAEFDVLWTLENGCQQSADSWTDIVTDVERKVVSKGARICALEAVPRYGEGPYRSREERLAMQTGPMSLVDFLPKDLENMDYVPFGMESTVENIINRRKNTDRKAAIARSRQQRKAATARNAATGCNSTASSSREHRGGDMHCADHEEGSFR